MGVTGQMPGNLFWRRAEYPCRTSVTDPNGKVTTYAYDDADRLLSVTDAANNTTQYAYDTENNLGCRLSVFSSQLSVRNKAGNFGFGYDELSRRTSMTRPNGVVSNYSYDNLSRLLSVLHQASGTTTIDGAGYTYDNAGNRTSKTNYLNSTVENYAYDAIYQLQQVTQGTNTTEYYTYDKVGNRLTSVGVASYSYNSSNQLTAADGTSFSYDHNGNATSKTDTSGQTTYAWDFENRLGSVTLPNGGGVVSFKYDPFGRRIQKSSASGTTTYVYDGANGVEELNGSGAVSARYVQGAGIDEPLAQSGSSLSFYDADGLGSITSLTDATGTPAATFVYGAFGVLSSSSGTVANSYRYTGREYDSETGLYYYRARYYDPTIGRFVSEDPIKFSGGINFYRYVENNPANFKDPSGETTYVCTAPLHALGDIGGKLAYYTLPFVGVPTYHEFLCVWDGQKMVCGGQDRTGGALSGAPGQPSNDTAMERGGGCSIVNDQECVDQCVTKAINNPNRPDYDLLNGWPKRNKGQNCQKWADDTLQSCVQQCVGKK